MIPLPVHYGHSRNGRNKKETIFKLFGIFWISMHTPLRNHINEIIVSLNDHAQMLSFSETVSGLEKDTALHLQTMGKV